MPGSIRVLTAPENPVPAPISPGWAMPSRLASFHEWRSLVRNIGLTFCATLTPSFCMYLLTLAFTAVLPFPRRSYTTPSRGTTLFQLTTGIGSKCRAGT
jgi:hypothetical protein